MAADSAVTVSSLRSGAKTYNTANKLFSLSKYAPVGIMTFGNADVMQIPWETIIKLFRRKLGKKTFETIDGYCEEFFNFLDRFEIEEQAGLIHIQIVAFQICSEIREMFEFNLMDSKNQDTESDEEQSDEDSQKQLFCSIIEWIEQDLSKNDQTITVSPKDRIVLLEKWKAELDETIREGLKVLAKFLDPEISAAITRIVVDMVCSRADDQAGVVFAGFGEKEYYPRYRAYNVGAVLQGKAVRRLVHFDDISTENGASIRPFAQQEEIISFMDGISPELWNTAKQSLETVFGENGLLPMKLSEAIAQFAQLDENGQESLLQKMRELCGGCLEVVLRCLKDDGRRIHSTPIINATQHLNKDELAQMAETLVNLESFRKKVTPELETVGGPVDIAVITKGDGLIWVKRKHYFQPELNHHFFRNYFNDANVQGERNEHD